MNFPFYIAKRYLISKKSHNAINIISWVSVLGIAIGTMALVIVLSASNGLQNLIEDLYASFDPDLKITLVEGKTFDEKEIPKAEILALDEVVYYNQSLEEIALIKYEDKQTVANIKGVEPIFYKMTGLDSMLISGNVSAEESSLILGWGVSDKLSLFVTNGIPNQTQIIIPKRGTKKGLTPESEFYRKYANTTGVFSVSPDFDTKYALADLNFVQTLLKQKGQLSSVELGLAKNVNWDEVKSKIQTIVGNKYEVKTRYELNEIIFKTNETEKWITTLILTFILIIASFNIIGSLTMLIIDKKKDIWILKTMGANNKLIRKIFFAEGMLINFLGAFIGMFLGALICWLQMQFSLLKLQGGVVEAYPVALQALDFIYILAIVVFIGLIASWYPVRILTKKHL